MKKMLRICAVLMMGVFVLSISGCNKNDIEGKNNEQKKDTLTVVINNDPGSMDPNDTDDFAHHQVTRQIYETLVVRDADGNLSPCLAESWEYQDDKTIIFHIRKGVLFHNGEELKASDVLFSFKRVFDDNMTGKNQIPFIDLTASKVIDDYTLQIVTTEPSALQLPMLESPKISIISEKAYNESNGDFNIAPIGTGPYKFVSYNTGDRVELTANENYWIKDEPKIKNVEFRIITDSSSRAIEAESGGADIVYDINANDVDRVRDNPNINLVTAMGYNTSYLCFNIAKEPLDNPLVREAIWYAVDVPNTIEVAYGDYGNIANGFVSPGVEGRNEELSTYFPKRDVNKAKELLAEAGYTDGLTLHVSCENSNQQRMDVAQSFQSQLAEVGITLELDFMEMNTWISSLFAGESELSIFGFTASTGEAGSVLMRWLPDSSTNKIFNWESDEYTSQCQKALGTIDEQARLELYKELQVMIMKDKIALPIWHKEINAAIKKDVQGFNLMPTYENHYLQSVYFE